MNLSDTDQRIYDSTDKWITEVETSIEIVSDEQLKNLSRLGVNIITACEIELRRRADGSE